MYLHQNFKDKSPSEASSGSANQQIFRLLYDPEARYIVY
jgi:hypothetical protein